MLTPDEKAYNPETAYEFLVPDPASPGDDDPDTPEEGASESDADAPEEAGSGSANVTGLRDISGVGPAKADALREAGFASIAGIRMATPAELSEASGVGETLAKRIKDEVGGTLGGNVEEDDAEADDTDDDVGKGDDGKADDTDDDVGKGDDGEADDTDDDAGKGDDNKTDDTDDDVGKGDDGKADHTDDDVGKGDDADGGSEENQDDEGDELEAVQDLGDDTIEPIPDEGDGLLGYGKAGGPGDDEEMPLTAHIEEMIKRLVIVAVVAGTVSLVVFPFADRVVNFLWNSILPVASASDARPRLYNVLEFWFTKVKVASLAGVIIGLPVFVYQTYRFMRPGLYPNERRYYLAAVPTSLVLALVGVAFAYFIILPSVFTYFLYYSEGVTTIGFALGRTFNLILIMMAYLAVVFQIPLFILLAMLMGLVTREWLAQRRLIFWGAFLGISFVFSPDPTGMVPILITLTMIALFEGTLLLTRWTQRRGGGESGIGA
jgi:sec-independent protein translocase protein TatC